MTYKYKYPHPSVTVDCVVFALAEDDLKILLIKRNLEPYHGKWALPGGFVRIDEDLESAAFRELKEETGVDKIYLEQLYTFGNPARDPRERVITVAYYALVNLTEHKVHASSDAENAGWFSIYDLPELAFDHDLIVETALKRLKGKIQYEPIIFELLPEKFTLTQLQKPYEIIRGHRFDKRNFRKKILSMKLLKNLDKVEMDVAHRAARLYSFNREKYLKLKLKGFTFGI